MKSILFTPGNVKAILDGLKWQTRRPVPEYLQIYNTVTKHIISGEFDFHFDGGVGQFVKPKYQVSDILYVKEAYYAYGKWEKNGLTKTGKQKYRFNDITLQASEKYIYATDSNKPNIIETKKDGLWHWYKRNALFMPLKAARLYLKITNVRVEKLQDISNYDCKAEGIDPWAKGKTFELRDQPLSVFQIAYSHLWESIHGPGSWNLNPWVFTYDFKRIEKPKN